MMYKILLIEDDVRLSAEIKEGLERYQFCVVEITNYLEIEREFLKIQPDLVLLDITLPYFDGYYVCRSIRKVSNVPILMVSARNEEMDQIRAIELGADDYLNKPFTMDMLITKVKAAIRRIYGEYATSGQNIVKLGDMTLDVDRMEFHYLQATESLNKNELKLLKRFLQQPNTYIAREELIEEVWDDFTFVEDNTLTVNIARIRRIFQDLQVNCSIKNKRGVGYMLEFPKR